MPPRRSFLLSLWVAAIAVQSPGIAAAADPKPPAPDTIPDTISGALDSLIRSERGPAGIPGLALVYLRGGDIAFAEGYGVADLASGQPVSPDSTRFPFGSLSKLVTATAVMQLVESGRISPGARVDAHLDPGVVPRGPGGPVTIHHLLTHTAGLEPANLGVAAERRAGLLELQDFLASSDLPRRVRPPGQLYVYSQHGYGLLGLVLEAVTGRDFEVYVDEEVFGPLGMESATFHRWTVSEATVATGYYGGERRRRAPAVHHQIPPAGGLVATPVDIGRLLAAHLAGGSPVLGEAATRRMQRRQWSPHPDPEVEGSSYGLFEYRACGIRALTTRGWVGGHAAYVHLVPDLGTGFLVAANASRLQGLDQGLREALHAHLAGGDCGDGAEAGRAAGPGRGAEGASHAVGSDEASVTGRYRSIGFGGRGVEALGRLLLSQVLTVRRRDDGSLVMDFGQDVAPLSRSDDRLFTASWWAGRDQNFVFLPVEGGEVRHMMWGGQAYERIPWFLGPGTLRAAMALAALLLASTLVLGLVRLVGDRVRGAVDGVSPDVVLRSVTVAACALYLAFGVGMSLELAGTGRYRFAFGITTTARVLLWALTLASGLSLVLATAAIPVWRRRWWSLPRRLHWSAVTLTALAVATGAAAIGLLPPP